MKSKWSAFAAILLLVALLLVTSGCATSNPADAETKAIAVAFVKAVFVDRDCDAAMNMTSGVTTYGYVDRKAIESTIQDDIRKNCTTDPASVDAGKVASGFKVPELTAADKERGAVERIAWFVGSSYACTGTQNAPRTTVVILDKANDKWTVSRTVLWYGVDYWD